MWVPHTLRGNENAFPKLGARLKARDSPPTDLVRQGSRDLGLFPWPVVAGRGGCVLQATNRR